MADVAVHITPQDPFHSSKATMNGHHMPDLSSGEVQAERKRRRAAEKEASRWRKKAAELQEVVEELQQQQTQQQQQASGQTSAQSTKDTAGQRVSDEEHVAHMVALIMTRAVARADARAQVAEEAQQAKLLSERAAREARMEDAIVRARARLEHEERLSWSRRLEQGALAAGFVGLGALGAYVTIRMVHSSSSAPSNHNWRTGTDTASLTQAAIASSTAPVDAILKHIPPQEAYQLGSLISTADVLEQRASAPAVAVPAPAMSAAVMAAAAGHSSSGAQPGAVHAVADRLAQHVGQRVDSMASGAPFGVVAASSVAETVSGMGSMLRFLGKLCERCW